MLQAEAENNLLLGIARKMVEAPNRYKSPVYLATIEEDEKIIGCAFRTPPHKIGLTRMPESALPILVDDIAEVYTDLPAALGKEDVVKKFSELWGNKKGVKASEGRRQRIYQLDQVMSPERILSGHMRVVETRESDIAAEWMDAFHNAVNAANYDTKQMTGERIVKQSLFFWYDGQPVSMAGWIGRTPNGVRIGFVYTPPHFRRKGYATACVAHLSQRLLDSGIRFCFLYTDLSNSTSNSIYQKIGYQPVCDVMDYDFEEMNK